MEHSDVKAFDWKRILIADYPYIFLLEVLARSIFCFIIVMVILKFMGKRGVKQLSIFELVIILTLGSAAGDVIFYDDVSILQVVVTFVGIILIYRITTWIIGKNKKAEHWLEGKPAVIVKDGKFNTKFFEAENISFEEFSMELRLEKVEHLGQVKLAIIEPSGDVSVYYFETKDTIYGLPILPDTSDDAVCQIEKPDTYACCKCGYTAEFESGNHTCPECKNDEWVVAINTKRVS